MKYLINPFWRLFVALFVAFAQTLYIVFYLFQWLWHFKKPFKMRRTFWFPINMSRFELTKEWYKNPWDALINKVTD